MNKKRILSLLLAVSMLASLPLFAAQADAAPNDPQPVADEKQGMVLKKESTPNKDGSYTITLEAYATGRSIITPGKSVPADIILVLDQSSSMTQSFTGVTGKNYVAYAADTTNSSHYSNRANGGNNNLYHKLEGNTYVAVYVDRTETEREKDPVSSEYNYTYYNNYVGGTKYYALIDGNYEQVTILREGEILNRTYTYTAGGRTIATSSGAFSQPTFSNTDNNILYIDGDRDYTYEYYYMLNGQKQVIATSDGNNGTCSETLYRLNQTTGNTTRIEALKSAVRTFANQVAENAMGPDKNSAADDVAHRVAVVGFAARNNTNPGGYVNTELFIGSNQYTYGAAATAQYGNALQSMYTDAGKRNIDASIEALEAHGGTHIDLGMEMANGILSQYPIAPDEQRNRVIVVFTDGYPGSGSWTSTDMTYANNAITHANTARNTYGADVYTVGIFDGANAQTNGNQNGNATAKANWFMQNLSSNLGTPQMPSYYLSASDSDKLNSVFQQIGDNVSTGGADNEELTAETVIADYVSEYFAFKVENGQPTPNSINLRFETHEYLGGDQTLDSSWEHNNKMLEGVSGTITAREGNNAPSVKVSGFDFAENFVGTAVQEDGSELLHGHKLVIKFDVVPRPGFLGGNNVPTNTGESGVYMKDADKPTMQFEIPRADVPIGEITIKADDKNVYYLGTLTENESHHDVDITVTDTYGFEQRLKCDEADDNFGLASWQTAYVDIKVEYREYENITDVNPKDEILAHLPKLEDLENDRKYDIGVKISPDSGDKTGAKEKFDSVNVNVFMPVYTHADDFVYCGDTAPTDDDLQDIKESLVWKHGDKASNDRDVEMIGEAPEYTETYTFDESLLKDGKINTKEDIPVSLRVEATNADGELVDITEHVTFEHEACDPDVDCTWTTPDPNNGNPAFLLHVKTCELTITKSGGAEGEPYVFNIYKDGALYTQATIVGNNSVTIKELPVGNYSIEEDISWSWRYTSAISSSATLSAETPTGTISCTNNKNTDQWLNDYTDVKTNTAGATAGVPST